jgi:hypothetical protein
MLPVPALIVTAEALEVDPMFTVEFVVDDVPIFTVVTPV